MTSEKVQGDNSDYEEVSKKNIIKAAIAIITTLLLVGIIWLVYFLMHNDDNDKKTNTTNNDTTTSAPAVKHGSSGKSIEQDEKDALQAATTLLNNAAKSPTNQTTQKRISELDNDNYKVVDKSVIDNVHFTPSSTNGMKSTAYQSLISINTIISSKNGTNILAPLASDSYKDVYVDQQIGTAYVPLSVYLKNTNSSTFNLEMVYVNGKWLFAPYSLINEVKLSAIFNAATNGQSTSTASASPTTTK